MAILESTLLFRDESCRNGVLLLTKLPYVMSSYSTWANPRQFEFRQRC
jgi:hypothetical protein